MLAAKIGRAALAAVDNRDALQGADAVVLGAPGANFLTPPKQHQYEIRC